MTDPDFSPVTGNRIRPVNDCLCSTCAALRSGEPDTAPKEKPPMTDAKPRLFTIHLVDRSAMPDAPPDPTPAIVQGMVDTVNREIEHGISAAKKIVDATIARANDAEREIADLRRQLSDALAAVEEWRGLATCREEQLRLLHQDYAGCVGERDAAREESAARDTVAAEIRRQLFEALEDVREWKDAARKTEMTCASVDSIKSERDAARAELRAAREKHAESLCRLIDERDEARKALADEVARGQNIGIAGCNLKAGSHVVWMDSAELAALRARVAELEMERGWSLGVKKFVTADGTQYSVAEYVELMRARVAELEAAAGTRDKRIIALCARINQIGALANCD